MISSVKNYKEIIYKPLENYKVGRNEITSGTVSPSYILPHSGPSTSAADYGRILWRYYCKLYDEREFT